MSTLTAFFGDTATMTGRRLRHEVRHIDGLLLAVVLPVMMLLLFVYVFGGAISTHDAYLAYVIPGIIVLAAGYGASQVALGVAADIDSGAIDRFRSLPTSSAAFLAGHVVSNLVRNWVSIALVIGLAFLIGFRATAGVPEWLATIGIITLWVLAIAWVSVAVGVAAGSPEAASGFTFFVLFVPYISSAYVPVETLPTFLRSLAENQPTTPVIEAMRALLTGGPVAVHAGAALLWLGGILALGMVAAVFLFRRRTAQS